MPRHIGGVRRNEHEDTACCLLWRAVALQRYHRDRHVAHAVRNSEYNFLAVNFDSGIALGLSEARVDEAKRNRVAAHAEGAPLLGDSLGHAQDRRLGSGIVELPRVAVQAGSGRDVDDNLIRLAAGTEMRSKCADEAKWSGGVAIEPDRQL